MQAREKLALKNMRFNRFILLRYSLALFFFANLNWFIFMLPSRSLMIFFPAAMMVTALFSIKEFLVLYSSSQKITLKKTRTYFLSQLVLNSSFVVFSLHGGFYSSAFPFMRDNLYGTIGTISVLAFGAVLSSFCLGKLSAISKDKDRGYKLFNNFRQSMKASETHGK